MYDTQAKFVAIFLAFCCVLTLVVADDSDTALQKVLDGDHRSVEHKARDKYRHPLQTLKFFGIREDMTVVEIWPGGRGWYLEILAPYLREKGRYIAAGFDLQAKSEFFQKANQEFLTKLAERPQLYDKVIVTELAVPNKLTIAEARSVDMVLTFRNIHNWMWSDSEKKVLEACYRALKPGGILGIVEHREREDNKTPEKKDKNGYVQEDYVIQLAESIGFKLVAKSDVNNNPKDTKDYPKGVWTLPPTLTLGEKDREKYLAIGESDRMTLKFEKVKKVKNSQ